MPHGPVSSSSPPSWLRNITFFSPICLLADSWKSSGWSSGRNHVMFCYAQCGRLCSPQVHQFPLLPPSSCRCHHLISSYAFPHHCPGGGTPTVSSTGATTSGSSLKSSGRSVFRIIPLQHLYRNYRSHSLFPTIRQDVSLFYVCPQIHLSVPGVLYWFKHYQLNILFHDELIHYKDSILLCVIETD